MALKFMESFGTSETELYTIQRKWSSTSVLGTSELMPGRVPETGNSLRFSGTSLKTNAFTSHATWVVGFAFVNRNLDAGQTVTILKILDDSTAQVELKFNTTTGVFTVHSAASTLATASVGLIGQKWYYIELKTTINASTGSVYLKINETTVASATSQDTQVSGNATANTIEFLSTGAKSANSYRIDDIYICDGSTGSLNDFLGDMKVEAVLATSNNSVQWTVNGNAENTNVEAIRLDSGPTISTATVDNKDTYYFGDVVKATSNIKGVCVNITARNNDATDHQIKAVCIGSAATESLGSTQNITSTDFSTFTEIYIVDPETSAAWTSSGFNGAKFGVKYIGTV